MPFHALSLSAYPFQPPKPESDKEENKHAFPHDSMGQVKCMWVVDADIEEANEAGKIQEKQERYP